MSRYVFWRVFGLFFCFFVSDVELLFCFFLFFL